MGHLKYRMSMVDQFFETESIEPEPQDGDGRDEVSESQKEIRLLVEIHAIERFLQTEIC